MCTVTFVPKHDGFLLAMNRDDTFLRATTIPPKIFANQKPVALYPSEPTGGTWIAVNDAGIAFTLLNWHRPISATKSRSRGEVIPGVVHSSDCDEASAMLIASDFGGMQPFRLIGFSPRERRIREWRWDSSFTIIDFPWEHRHWFSSGLSDDEASARRGAICRAALIQPDALSPAWIRRLHQSHEPERNAFSICAHRDTAGTLSYTEVNLSATGIVMHYRAGSSCSTEPLVTVHLPLGHIPVPFV